MFMRVPLWIVWLLERVYNVRKKGKSNCECPSRLGGVHTGKIAMFLVYLFTVTIAVCPETFAEETRVILRMDDSGFGRHTPNIDEEFLSDAEITRRVIDIVVKYDAHVTIGVIPNVVSGSPGYRPKNPEYAPLSSCLEEIEVLVEGMATGHVEIALHGHTHEVLTIHDGHGSEFGGLPFDEQLRRLSLGKEEIEQSLGITVDIFIPPFNNHDNATLSALQALGFKAISSGAKEGDAVEDLFLVPYTTSLKSLMKTSRGDFRFEVPVLINALFHVYDFSESGSHQAYLSLTDFDAFLAEMSRNQSVRFTTIANECPRNGESFRSKDSRLYAQYIDRVGRIRHILALLGTIGERIRAGIPSAELVYPIPLMRRLTNRMIWVEAIVLSVLFAVTGILVYQVLRRTCRFPWSRRVEVAVVICSSLCCVLLLLEGMFGIFGTRGFGSRLLLATCFSSAICLVTASHLSLKAINSREKKGKPGRFGVGSIFHVSREGRTR